MILAGSRATAEDWRAATQRWATWRALARLRSLPLARALERADLALRGFSTGGPFVVACSWGKDSQVLLLALLRARRHLAAPCIVNHVRWLPVENPDMLAARDAFLARFPELRPLYRESVMRVPFAGGRWDVDRAEVEHLPDEIAALPAYRYVTGVRGDESRARLLRQRVFGRATASTCAPITYLSDDAVYQLAAAHDLPLPHTYACNYSGALDQRHLRFDYLAGDEGEGWGRAAWELTYYRAEVMALRAGLAAA